MSTSNGRLAGLMESRRLELGIKTWRALADKAGVSYETVRALKAGGTVAPSSEFAIERALCWGPGSIKRIRAGGGAVEGVRQVRTTTRPSPAAVSREERRERIAAALQEAQNILDGGGIDAIEDMEEVAAELDKLIRAANRRWRDVRE